MDGTEYTEDGLNVLSNYKPDSNPVKFWLKGCEGSTDAKGDPSGSSIKGVQFDATYDFYLDDFGNIVGFREVEGAPTNYALVLDSAYSINGLRTTGDVKILMADGTQATYAVDMDATADKFEDAALDTDTSNPDGADVGDNDVANTPIEKWFNNTAITSKNSMEAVLDFMGTDDAGVDNNQDKGYAAGNLIAYTIDEDTEEITFQPASLDLGTWVNGNSTQYNKATNGFFEAQQPGDSIILNRDLENGDVDLYYKHDGASDTTTTGSIGIDEDTIIYYYNGKEGNVVKGYDNMANSIPATGSTVNGTIDKSNTKVSAVMFNDDTDVAEAIVVYTTKAAFGSEDYLFIMEDFDKHHL